MSRGGFSLWESPNTMQGVGLGRSETTVRKYKVDEEWRHRVFDKANSGAESGEAPRHALDKVKSRAVSAEVHRRVFDEVETNAVSTKPVVLNTDVAEVGLRGGIREREACVKVARGGYGTAGNDPLCMQVCMQGNTYSELMEAGCRSGESSRPRPIVGYESRHEITPRTCGEFEYDCILIPVARSATCNVRCILPCSPSRLQPSAHE